MADYGVTNDKFKMFQKCSMYAALLMPFRNFAYKKKKKEITAIQHILAESLKQSSDVMKFVTHSLKNLAEFERAFMSYNVRDEKSELGPE